MRLAALIKYSAWKKLCDKSLCKARPDSPKSRKHKPYSLEINCCKLGSHNRFFKFPVASPLQVLLAFCELLLFIRQRQGFCNHPGLVKFCRYQSLVKPIFAQRDLRSIASIYELTRVCTCTAKTQKKYFYFLKKHFLSLNWDDGYIFCTISVFVLVFPLSFYYPRRDFAQKAKS